MPGVNVDVLNSPPSVDQLKSVGIDAVRLVSKPDPNSDAVHPDIEQYLADLKAAGIFALVVITGESRGRIPANNHGWLQCRNEEDASADAVASEPMTPAAYVQEFNTYSQTYPGFTWIAGGLCAGDYSAAYWSEIAPQLVNCAGFALHPYLKTPDEAVALVAAHQAVTPDHLAFVTEFNCSAADLPEMLAKLEGCTAGQYWYAAGDWMNDGNTGNCTGFGLLDHPDKLAAWQTPYVQPETKTGLWVDASNYTGQLTDQGCADLKSAGVVGVIVQAVTGLNGLSYTRQQLDACQRNGLRIMGYVFPGGLSYKLPMFDGFPIEALWLDLELPVSVDTVNAALARCDAYTGKQTGIYTGKWFFDQQGWSGLSLWSDRPLWDSYYDKVADRAVDFRPYGGWTASSIKQYAGTSDIGNVHQIDLDVI